MDKRYLFDICLIVGLLVLASYFIWKEVTKEEPISVLYGYPAYNRTWLTVYHYRRSDRWVFEWDDLFDEGRGHPFTPLSKCFLYEDDESGATPEELLEAWRLCRNRGYL